MVVYVDVIWDFQNAWIPVFHHEADRAAYIGRLRNNIETSLKRFRSDYVVGRFFAVGPSTGEMCNALRPEFGRTMELIAITNLNILCATCETEVVNFPGINEVLISRTTDRADVLAVIRMFRSSLQGRKNILLIAGDWDFVSTVTTLIEIGAYVMVAKPGTNSARNLYGRKTWIWDYMQMNGGSSPVQT
uniref:NYN domain-containing protein n=1 Tax=Noccaea caerulescens TaxID=107243 RepID=A0A1J3J5U9_NOCCA